MVGSLKNLKWSMSEHESGKNSPKAGPSVHVKFGPSRKVPERELAGINAKIVPIVAAFIFISLEAKAELDEVPTMTSLLSGMSSTIGRRVKQSFLVRKTK